MPKLSDNVKFFIVQGLACFDTPSQVSKAVKAEFAIDIPRSQVQLYDPTSAVGRSLSQKYKAIFEATRTRFLEEVKEIPIANQAFRLRALDTMYQRAISRGNDILAKDVIEQAAKEANGFYSGKNQGDTPNTNPLVAWLQQIGGTSIPIAHNIESESTVMEGEFVAESVNASKPEKSEKPKRLTLVRD